MSTKNIDASSRKMQPPTFPLIHGRLTLHFWGLHNSSIFMSTILGPCLDAKARFLSFNRTQSGAVTGLPTGHNTLKRHLYLTGLSDSPLCRRCRAQEETSFHILCEREAFASHRRVYLGSSFLEPEDIKSISLGAIWNFSKVTGLP
jgi:hypothetical protein